ncbi:MAG: galactokinase, partial [bacterium]
MSSGLALSQLCNAKLSRMDLARIGQKAEHEFAGVKCGLMDQITSLFGSSGSLVMTDFRSLDVKDIQLGAGPSGETPCFVVCNTGVKHTLVDSEYNERRARCEEASAFFRSVLDHPVTALRDVSWKEWQEFSPRMNPTAARRAAHIIGENARVLQGVELLTAGNLRKFGELMFESHDSSRKHFENSCPELDFVVDGAMSMATVSGARLSGGGFGGCAIILTGTNDSEEVGATLSAAFEKRFAGPCACMAVKPSAGGRLVDAATGI